MSLSSSPIEQQQEVTGPDEEPQLNDQISARGLITGYVVRVQDAMKPNTRARRQSETGWYFSRWVRGLKLYEKYPDTGFSNLLHLPGFPDRRFHRRAHTIVWKTSVGARLVYRVPWTRDHQLSI